MDPPYTFDIPSILLNEEKLPSKLKTPRAKIRIASPLNTTDKRDKFSMKSVIEIDVSMVGADYRYPWKKKQQEEVGGSGFAVEGRLIVTNDHVIHEESDLYVKKPGSSTKFKASVACAAREVDIALLEVKDPEFWKDLPLLNIRDNLPNLGDEVIAIGYPIGGLGLSITRGVVSRVVLHSVSFGASEVLSIQIDAAINSGNSGGPVFDEHDNVIGVAQSSLVDSDGVSYIMAGEVVNMVLEQYKEQKRFLGLSRLPFEFQTLESESHRQMLKVNKKDCGIRISEVSPVGPLHNIIFPDDVIMEIGGIEIAGDSTIRLSSSRDNERVGFTYAVTSRPVGGICDLKVSRGGVLKSIVCVLDPPKRLVPILHEVDCLPRYIIVGGFVFVALSIPLIEAANDLRYCSTELFPFIFAFPEYEGQEAIVLKDILSSSVNLGYKTSRGSKRLLAECGGVKIKNLNHLATLVDKCDDEFYTFKFSNWEAVLDREKCISKESSLLQRHGISQPRVLDNVGGKQ